MEETMRTLFTTTAISLGLALALTAGPATAAKRAAHPGYEANAQATEAIPDADFTGSELSAMRAKTLHDCEASRDTQTDYTWGVRRDDVYRACMASHGQPE
jgi:hypothetical protein